MYTVKMKAQDNVAVAVRDIPAGTLIEEGILTLNDIPQAHKVALINFKKGDKVLR